MKENILSRILALKTASLPELQKEYGTLYDGKKAPSTNKTYLWQKIAYRIQELEYGGLPEEAQNKAKELTQEYDPINNKALRPNCTMKQSMLRDKRLPVPGTLITKNYKGANIQVKVLEKDFEYNGKVYKTLTKIAKEITGSHWNGYLFFSL
jgi:ABC-type cobalt transport system substrate-binding protein